MIVVTSSEVTGRRVTRTLGLVRGNTIRARHLGRDIMAVFRGDRHLQRAIETVSVGINDVNDVTPVVDPLQSFNVNEDAINTTSLGFVTVTDPDGSPRLRNPCGLGTAMWTRAALIRGSSKPSTWSW